MAGIWFSLLIGMVLFIMVIAAAVANTSTSQPSTVKIKPHSILTIDLSGEVADREQAPDLMSQIYGDETKILALNNMVKAIQCAATDANVEGIYLKCNGVSIGMAQLQALVDALRLFRHSGKWVVSYADNYTQADYIIACAGDSIFVNPIGMVDVHGLSSTTLYFKDLLDKLGVDVQVVKVGTFKSAVEPFTQRESSEANKLQQRVYINSIWQSLRSIIAQGRGVSDSTVTRWADVNLYAQPASYLLDQRVADDTIYRHAMKERLAAITAQKEPSLVDLSDYMLTKTVQTFDNRGSKHIAVLYATGDITESGKDGIASERLVPEILKLADDETIDGLIMRVNSGGGSAFASEQIWEALEQFKQKTGKPFYVSMSDMAASGGYYISCGADRIYAESETLTGSIGVFGLIPNLQGLLANKLGITTSTEATNTGAFPSVLRAMTPQQRAAMQGYVERTYQLFVERCAAGRGLSVDSVKVIAEGRVWDGATAQTIGLVDEIGGLQQAIADMAASLDALGDVKVEEYPSLQTKWWEELLKMSQSMETRYVRSRLGDAWPYYQAVEQVKQLDPRQARMEVITLY